MEHLRDSIQDENYQSVLNRLENYGLEGHAHEVVMRDLIDGHKVISFFLNDMYALK